MTRRDTDSFQGVQERIGMPGPDGMLFHTAAPQVVGLREESASQPLGSDGGAGSWVEADPVPDGQHLS